MADVNEPRRPVRILYVLPSFSIGGIERQLVTIAPALIAHGFELHLATLFGYPGRVDLYGQLPPSVTVHRFNLLGPRLLPGIAGFVGAVRKLKPDIVVASMSSGHYAASVARSFCDFKLVLREHNAYTDKSWLHWRLDRGAARRASRLVAVSAGVADYASARSGITRSRYEVIPNGVDLARQVPADPARRAAARAALGVPTDAAVVLHAARLKPQKNQALLLDAFAALRRARPEAVLLVAGDGSERAALERHATSLPLGASVRFLGFVAEPADLFAAADVAALTSDREGFPNFLVEALASGLPVVTADVPGVAELRAAAEGSGAVTVAPRNVEQFAAALGTALAAAPSLRGPARRAAESFDVRAIAECYAGLFRELAGR